MADAIAKVVLEIGGGPQKGAPPGGSGPHVFNNFLSLSANVTTPLLLSGGRRGVGGPFGDQIRLNAQGGSQGLPPWWRLFGAPSRELVRGRDLAQGPYLFNTFKGLQRVLNPLGPLECALFEGFHYARFGVSLWKSIGFSYDF